ncbi:TolB-like translocation protein [Solicola gregarius]|uniref:Uncharacterized protein n=1 Tax=Solicola gregarius TaxID=2908642 RepID=A0AA46TDW3_9ACTN|nr:hypothetical protein [Solicola gregarius]UYM03496.1 hypothetical protein L0C25_13105 [Solicola gregarius]
MSRIAVRRQLVCGIAAVALVGAVPATAAQAEPEPKPPTTTFNPNSLAKGKTTAAYVDGKTLHDGKKKLKLKVPHDVWGVDRLGRGYLVRTDDPKSGWGQILYRVGPRGGKATRLHRFGRQVWSVTPSSNGRRIAVQIFDPARLYVVNAKTGKVTRQKKIGRQNVLDYDGQRILMARFRAKQNKTAMSWYRPGTDKYDKIGTVPTWARFADPDLDLIGLGADQGCYDVRRFKAPREKLWQFCSKKGIPDGITFSPDGKYMLTSVSFHKQPKIDTLTVRRVRDGSVVRRFQAREFSAAGWEDAKTIVVEAAAQKKAARVRCTIGGKCKRVSRLVKGGNNFGALNKLDTEFVDLKLLS